MNPIKKNILAVVVGFVVGGSVNMGLITIGPNVIPFPEGVDASDMSDMEDMEKLKEAMKLFTPANFLFPFLAHALGTLVAAVIAAKLAASHPMKLALGIGVGFLMGGLMMVAMCGGPWWFIAADLLLAYFPMAYLGAILAGAKTPPIATDAGNES